MRLSIVGGIGTGAKAAGGAFFAIVLALSAPPLFGLEARNIRFRHITPEDGLSQATVHAIVQDRDGLMWFGTQEGLNRYDGYEFETFSPDPDDSGSRSMPYVRALHEDRNGVLWVGTDDGLHRFDRETSEFVRYENDPTNPTSLSNNRVRVIYEDRDGSLWLGTEGGGLNHFDRAKEVFTRFNHNPSNPTSLSNDYIRSVVQDRDGALWVGTEGGGLNRMDTVTGRFRHFVHDPQNRRSLGSNGLRVVYQDREGTLWVGTDDAGLDRFDPATENFAISGTIPGTRQPRERLGPSHPPGLGERSGSGPTGEFASTGRDGNFLLRSRSHGPGESRREPGHRDLRGSRCGPLGRHLQRGQQLEHRHGLLLALQERR
jgi:sugar lactone lactonase YvrE